MKEEDRDEYGSLLRELISKKKEDAVSSLRAEGTDIPWAGYFYVDEALEYLGIEPKKRSLLWRPIRNYAWERGEWFRNAGSKGYLVPPPFKNKEELEQFQKEMVHDGPLAVYRIIRAMARWALPEMISAQRKGGVPPRTIEDVLLDGGMNPKKWDEFADAIGAPKWEQLMNGESTSGEDEDELDDILSLPEEE